MDIDTFKIRNSRYIIVLANFLSQNSTHRFY